MKHFREVYGPEFGTFSEGCASLNDVASDLDAVRAARQCVAEGYYETAIYRDTVAKHAVEITVETIAGVYTEVFVPKRVPWSHRSDSFASPEASRVASPGSRPGLRLGAAALPACGDHGRGGRSVEVVAASRGRVPCEGP